MSGSKRFFETLSAAWHTTTSYWKNNNNNHMPFISQWDNFRVHFSFFAFLLKTNSLFPGRKYEACKRGWEIWYSRLPQTRKGAFSEKKIRIDKACNSPRHFLAMQGIKDRKNSFDSVLKRNEARYTELQTRESKKGYIKRRKLKECKRTKKPLRKICCRPEM